MLVFTHLILAALTHFDAIDRCAPSCNVRHVIYFKGTADLLTDSPVDTRALVPASHIKVLWLGSRHNIDRLTVYHEVYHVWSSTVGVVGSAVHATFWRCH